MERRRLPAAPEGDYLTSWHGAALWLRRWFLWPTCVARVRGRPQHRASGHRAEARLVVRLVGAHEPVPDVEVEAIVAARRFVVHRVVGRRVEQEAQPRGHQPARMEL